MVDDAQTRTELPPIKACTVSRDIECFEALIDDMEACLGEAWGDLTFDEAPIFLRQKEAESLEFLAIAMDDKDDPDRMKALISDIKSKGIKVILVTYDLLPVALHNMMRAGADEFLPYPIPKGELSQAIERVTAPPPAAPIAPAPALIEGPAPNTDAQLPATLNHQGAVFAVQGLAGGTGASTFATNLAWELAHLEKQPTYKVCLLDLDLQFGSVASMLDLPQRPAVIELLTNTDSIDESSFLQSMQHVDEALMVLTAPDELVPLDILRGDDVARLITTARTVADYVVIDMPRTLTDWTETVLNESQLYFAMLEAELLSAQNCVRFKTALAAEGLPIEKLRFVLNRAPKFTDLNGRSRVKRMCESLDIGLEVQLPDGGKNVTQTSNQGEPLGSAQPKNPLRKEILKLAKGIHALGAVGADAA